MEISAQQIAQLLKGEIVGNPAVVVSDISKIEEGRIGTLSFLANPKYTPYIYTTQSSIVLVNNSFVAEGDIAATLIRVENAYESFAQLLQYAETVKNAGKQKTGVSEQAYIDPSATVGSNVYIAPFVYVGANARIGNNAKLYPHTYIGDDVTVGDNTTIAAGVKVYNECLIGQNCIVHAGVVIGSDGFGFAQQNTDGHYKKIPQLGNVVIEDDVEIGANTTIDRATIGSTFIRKGVKLDNLIQIAHNVEIGENTVIAAQTGVSGSTKIGRNCMFGGQVGFAGHAIIADNVKIGAQSGVAGNVSEDGAVIQGTPAIGLRNFYRSSAVFKNLPEMSRRVTDLEHQLKTLTELYNKLG